METHIYEVTSPGMYLGAKSIVLAKSPQHAIELHLQATGLENQDCDTDIQEMDVVFIKNGTPATEHVFYSQDGDY